MQAGAAHSTCSGDHDVCFVVSWKDTDVIVWDTVSESGLYR